ncbi:uncharacterized protein DS421_15g506500 [Arachis hypogaea]|nr:uncharacterized protein DS421_15g506500 [Arachis hypogaea]
MRGKGREALPVVTTATVTADLEGKMRVRERDAQNARREEEKGSSSLPSSPRLAAAAVVGSRRCRWKEPNKDRRSLLMLPQRGRKGRDAAVLIAFLISVMFHECVSLSHLNYVFNKAFHSFLQACWDLCYQKTVLSLPDVTAGASASLLSIGCTTTGAAAALLVLGVNVSALNHCNYEAVFDGVVAEKVVSVANAAAICSVQDCCCCCCELGRRGQA